jgi:hypothetical protein
LHKELVVCAGDVAFGSASRSTIAARAAKYLGDNFRIFLGRQNGFAREPRRPLQWRQRFAAPIALKIGLAPACAEFLARILFS